MDKIRVLRIISYEGPREVVEENISKAIHGSKEWGLEGRRIKITATTLGEFPEILAPPPFEEMSEEELDREREKLEAGLAIIRQVRGDRGENG